MNKKSELTELANLFTKLGFTAFGGPAAHMAMMRAEVVEKRGWMNEQHFLDLIGATNLIPGPNSTEMALHIGQERAGWKGLLAAGFCFILPAVFITGIFAWLYKLYGKVPQVQPFIYGIKPAIIVIVLMAIFPLAKKALKTAEVGILGMAVLVLSLMGYNEIALMFGAGFAAAGIAYIRKSGSSAGALLPFTLLQVTKPPALLSISQTNLFFTFLKIGAILYGSGYVLFAFLDSELVTRGILTRQQLVDAIAVGQFTPGPVFSSVTFIGYQISGFSGAGLATAGVFLPSFVFVALLNPLVKKMRDSELFSAFLDGVNMASIAIIVTVCYLMGKEGINDWRGIVIAGISLILLLRFRKLNSAWVVLVGSGLGFLLHLL